MAGGVRGGEWGVHSGRGRLYLQDSREQTLHPGFRDLCAHPRDESDGSSSLALFGKPEKGHNRMRQFHVSGASVW